MNNNTEYILKRLQEPNVPDGVRRAFEQILTSQEEESYHGFVVGERVHYDHHGSGTVASRTEMDKANRNHGIHWNENHEYVPIIFDSGRATGISAGAVIRI